MNDQRAGFELNWAGTSATLFFCGLLVAFGIFTMLIAYLQPSAPSWHNVISEESLSFAETGKNLARGKGFATGWILPHAFNYAGNVEKFPDLYNPPLYPAILGFLFAVFGAHSMTIVLCTGLLFLGTGVCIFLFARDAFGTDMGLAAALLFLGNPLMLKSVMEGGSMVLLVFLVNALFWLFYKTQMSTPRAYMGLGALAGLCYLTEYQYWVLMLPLCAWCAASPRDQRGRNLLSLIAGFCAVSAWWWLRNIIITGNPFFTLRMGAGLYGGVFTCALAPVLRGGRGILELSARLANLQGQSAELLLVFSNWLGILFAAAAFWKCPNPSLQRTRNMMYAVALTVWLLVVSRSRPIANGQGLPFLPFVCVIVSGYFFSITTAWDIRRFRTRMALMAVLVFSNMFSYYSWVGTQGAPLDWNCAFLDKVPRDRVMFSDFALKIAWLKDRPAIDIPYSRDDCARITAALQQGAAVYMSPDFNSDCSQFWHDIYATAEAGALSKDLPFSHGEFIEDRDYLFY